MSPLRKELIYSLDNDKIKVVLDKHWPIIFIENNNYELIEYVLKDIKENYATNNGVLVSVLIENKRTGEILDKYNYSLSNRSYIIEYKTDNFDITKFKCNSNINDKAKEYFINKFNNLYNLNSGKEIINKMIYNKDSIYTFYNSENEIIGMTDAILIDNNLSIHNIFAESKEILVFILKYISNLYKKDITILCGYNNMLENALEEINAVIDSSRYIIK